MSEELEFVVDCPYRLPACCDSWCTGWQSVLLRTINWIFWNFAQHFNLNSLLNRTHGDWLKIPLLI